MTESLALNLRPDCHFFIAVTVPALYVPVALIPQPSARPDRGSLRSLAQRLAGYVVNDLRSAEEPEGALNRAVRWHTTGFADL